MLRGYRVSCYGEDINIGASNLSNVNFSNIGQQMKIIDMMKYFQTSLARVASTVTSGEKERINELMLHFWVRHGIFRKVWLTLTQDVKGKNYRCFIWWKKGMIPYKKIIGTNSLDIVPEKDFFDASEFYSHLKNKCITKSDYETGKYLCKRMHTKRSFKSNYSTTNIFCSYWNFRENLDLRF